MFYWIYEIPSLLAVAVFGTAFVAIFLLGAVILRPFVRPWFHREPGLNAVLGDTLQYFGIIYGLLLGLLAVGTYENHSDAEKAVVTEASALLALYRSDLRTLARDYARLTIEDAWPQQRRGIVPLPGVRSQARQSFAAWRAELVLHRDHDLPDRDPRFSASGLNASRTSAHLGDGVGKALGVDRLRQHGCARHQVADALDGIGIVVRCDEDHRHIEHLSEPARDLDPFAASFETNVNHDNVGPVGHGKRVRFPGIGRYVAVVETQSVHDCFKIVRNQELVLYDQGTPAPGRRILDHCQTPRQCLRSKR